VVDYAGASVLIVEDGTLRNEAHRGLAIDKPFVQPENRHLWDAIPMDELLIVDDLHAGNGLAGVWRQVQESEFDEDWSRVRTWMSIPFAVEESLSGVLLLYHCQPGAYTSHHAALAQTIANQAATAIENAHLFGQTRRLAVLEERQRLARELHDSVSQVLYSIGLAGHTALKLLKRDPERAAEPINYVLSLAEAGLTEMRALIFELRPESLEKDGLVVALDRQVAATRARHHLEVRTDLCEEPSVRAEVKEAIYRIAQEALNNVAKHAQASQVFLRLCEVPDGLVLDVQDDGVGFDPQREYPGQMGLISMHERAAEVKGELQVESVTGEGTHIRVCVPIGS